MFQNNDTLSVGCCEFNEKVFAAVKQFKDANSITFLSDNGISAYSFGYLFEGMEVWIKSIGEYGINQGDRISVIAPASPCSVCAILAMAMCNVTAVMIDPNLPSDEINRLLAYSDTRGVLATESIYNLLSEDIIRNIPVFDIGSGTFKPVLFPESVKFVKCDETSDKGRDVIAVLFSSGTSGSMKGVMITYESILFSYEKQRYVFGLSAGEKYLHILPLNHISGYSSLMTFILSGCNIGLIQNANAAKLQKAFMEFNPHYFCMVPKVYDTIAEKIRAEIQKKNPAVRFSATMLINFCGACRKIFGIKLGKYLLKAVYSKAFGKNISGLAVMGSMCKPETARLFLNMGIDWANLYGTTETSAPISSTSIFDRYVYDSVGKANQFDDISIKINQPDSGEIGEIYVKTPMIMNGYFRDPEATSNAFDDGYFKTGDLGYIDGRGYLHITGRSKEVIILHNGEKASAQDVDHFYQAVCPDAAIACCTMTDSNGTDDIHIFVEIADKSPEIIEKAVSAIKDKSLEISSIYNLAGIHTIDKIPVTSIGKVKRYLLKEQLEKNAVSVSSALTTSSENGSIEDIVTTIIIKHTKLCEEITPKSRLAEDLGFDSLALFEAASEISVKTGNDVFGALENVKTVGELIDAAKNKSSHIQALDLSEFPYAKTDKDIKTLKRWIKSMRRIYSFEVSGTENIPKNENFIICSNHINNLDPIWLLAAMGEMDYQKIGCLAAVHLFQNKRTRGLFNMIGAVPVDRSGNTTPALNRCKELLLTGYSLIIFPEGSRTRDGSMLPFKNGAAALSIDTGKPIIPSKISGGFEIFPRHKKLPRFFDFGKMRKFTIKITFGKSIFPCGNEQQEITDKLRSTINDL